MLVKELFEDSEGSNPHVYAAVMEELDYAEYDAFDYMSNVIEDKDESSTPSAPDSSKFKTTHGNYKSIVSNAVSHGNKYRPTIKFIRAAKLGGVYDKKHHDKVWSYFVDVAEMFNAKEHNDTYTIDTDKGNIFIRKADGTNFSLYGYSKE